MTTGIDDTLRINPRSLRVLRQLRGLNQTQLAKHSGLSQGYLSDLERGDKQARPATIKALADALDVPLSTLFGDLPNDLQAILQRISPTPKTKAATS